MIRGSGVWTKGQHSWNISVTKEVKGGAKGTVGIVSGMLQALLLVSNQASPSKGTKQQFICLFNAVFSPKLQSPLVWNGVVKQGGLWCHVPVFPLNTGLEMIIRRDCISTPLACARVWKSQLFSSLCSQ